MVGAIVRLFVLVMVLSCVLSGCVTQTIRTTERYSPEFYLAEREFKRVQILPIHMQMYRFEADGRVEPITDQVAQKARELKAGLGEQLTAKSYTVVAPEHSGDHALFKIINPELAQFEGPSFTLTEKIGLGWEADRNKVQVIDFNFLDSVLEGSRSDDVDAYLFVDYTAFHRVPSFQFGWETSQRVPSWLPAFPPPNRSVVNFEGSQLEHGFVRAVLLDARTGHLLWANSHDFGFRRGVYENDSWQSWVTAADSASVARAVLQALVSADQAKPSGNNDNWVWQNTLSLDVRLPSNLQSHECGLTGLARQAFTKEAGEQSIRIVDAADDVPNLVLRVDKIREGHFAKADSKVSMTALLYQNERLVGNQVVEENVDVWQSYDGLCGRLESAFGRSLEPIWSWLDNPTWSPWIK